MMIKTILAVIISVFVCGEARAHISHFPVHPVRVHVRVEKDQIQVRIKSHALVWRETVLGLCHEKIPATDWPDIWVKKAADHIHQSFQLSVDRTRLEGRLARYQYIEEPLRPGEVYFLFSVVYPLPAGGPFLSGKSEFFKLHWRKRQKEKFDAHVHEEFGSILSFSGKENIRLFVPMEKSGFRVALEDVRMTKAEYLAESVQKGFMQLFQWPPFFLFVLGALLYGPRRKAAAWGCGGFAVLSGLGVLAPVPFSEPLLLRLGWGAVAAMGIIAALRAGPGVWLAGMGVSALIWGALWAKTTSLFSFSQEMVLSAKISYFTGSLLGGVAAGVLAAAAIFGYKKYRRWSSELMAERIMRAHLRFGSLAVAAVALFQLIRDIIKG